MALYKINLKKKESTVEVTVRLLDSQAKSEEETIACSNASWLVWFFGFCFACEQALRGALLRGREKATSLQFEYLHQNRCEMLIGGDDIGNDVITLCTCFSMFAYIGARFIFALIGGNLTAQTTGSPRGIGIEIQIAEAK